MPESWPRLSETLPGAPSLDACMNCQRTWEECDLSRWQEHDDQDQPEPVIFVLCTPCSRAIIDPHPRLYRQLPRNEPMPGAMLLCEGCPHRDGLGCRHPDLKANGGPGLAIMAPRPTVAFVDGTRGGKRTGWKETWWPGPPTRCKGRHPGPQVEATDA
jgi:hypothetical protein